MIKLLCQNYDIKTKCAIIKYTLVFNQNLIFKFFIMGHPEKPTSNNGQEGKEERLDIQETKGTIPKVIADINNRLQEIDRETKAGTEENKKARIRAYREGLNVLRGVRNLKIKNLEALKTTGGDEKKKMELEASLNRIDETIKTWREEIKENN